MCIGTLVLLIRASTFFNFFPDSETLLSHGVQGVSGGSLNKAGNLLRKMRLHHSLIFHRYCFMNHVKNNHISHQEGWCLPPSGPGQHPADGSPLFQHFQPLPANFNGWQPMAANLKQPPPPSPPLPPKTRLRQAPVPPPDWGTPGVAHHSRGPQLT